MTPDDASGEDATTTAPAPAEAVHPPSAESESRRLLGRLREAMAQDAEGQTRLDRIVALVADSMRTEVCSVYLFRDPQTLELSATHGLNPEAVHRTRMRLGEGLVGRVAREGAPVNEADAPAAKGFRFMPETGEERYSSFLGVPIQRLGERLGVLVVQSREGRRFTADGIYALEIVAMVLAEMAELGHLAGADLIATHRHPAQVRGLVGQEGTAGGHVWLHEPRVVVTNPIGEDPAHERRRLTEALASLRGSVDRMLDDLGPVTADTADQRDVLEAYRMFAASRGWVRRMEAAVEGGLSAEAAVEKEQSAAHARMLRADPYLRERLGDLDDLSNRLLRLLTGQGAETGAEMPEHPILVARNVGPGELLDYGRRLRGIVLEEGSVGSHAAIVARALAIPLLIQARGVLAEALNGDRILVDGENGAAHLRPDETVEAAFRDKMAMQAEAQSRYASLRHLPAQALCGSVVSLHMNAGLMADLPSLEGSGAEGVGLFRTELQFLARSKVPRRGELAALYARVMDAAKGKRVVFRTLDIGSDKVLPFMKRQDEPNPALGWRAIRVALDKRGVMRMQLQALIRAAAGRPLWVMFPFVAQLEEFTAARDCLLAEMEREGKLGHALPEALQIGAMLETPSLAFAPRRFFEMADFVSIGGNDLKQFFFAADRENERVRRRYDSLNVSYLSFLGQIVDRCAEVGTPLSFCGEDAGRPVEAVALSAMGLRMLSMRPASIGPVKSLLRRVDLDEARAVVEGAREAGEMSVRPALLGWLRSGGWAL